VQKVFIDLYKKGLIYRGKRMVNWCPATLTALSDEEVDMEPQQGSLYYFRAEVAEQPGTFLTIATTRPETIPGDTGIAVNPKDPRYTRLVGQHVLRPLPAEYPREKKLIPIVADEQVEFEFGTGVLKVTPAHDKADFEIGRRHGLPAVDIMNPNGSMNDLAGADLRGLDRFEARRVAVEKLKALGALVKEEPYQNKIGFSQRAKVPIEPRLSEQWFLKYPSVERARACVETGALKFHPERWSKVYDHWMGNLQDWCISRQLWWGHRIPVWYSNKGWSRLNHQIAIVDIEDAPLPEHSIHAAREGAWKLLDERGWLNRAFGNLDTGLDFTVTKSGLKHAFSHPGIENVIAATALPDLIRTALLMSETWHMPHIPEIKRVLQLLAAMRYKGVVYAIKITVKEYLDGSRIYDHEAQKTTASGGKSPERHSQAGELRDRPTPDAGILIAQLLPDVNREPALTRVQENQPGEGWEQDPDVLDTWFSSWLWPFATMGWPEQTETLKKFYPTTDLVTGPDIIFFWVARMIMAGYEFMGDLPFRNVYFTGIIRDKQGRKMSKTLGNSPDPLDLIAKYGADALRFGTMRSAPLGQDMLFDEKDVELGRNFCNKLWNACRFRQLQGGEVQCEIDPARLTSDDQWLLLKLDQAIREITGALDGYRFNEAAQTLYRFFWSEFCDWYLEASKAFLYGGDAGIKANTLAVIDFALSHTLRLFHPFLPFITEELWEGMGYNQDMPAEQGGRTIMFAPWPKPLDEDIRAHYGLDDSALSFVNNKYELVTQGRNLRRETGVPSNKKARFVLKPASPLAVNDVGVLKILLNADPFEVDPNYQPGKGTPVVHAALGELYLPLEGLIDVAAEKARLAKELEKIQAEIDKVQQKLNNPAFVQKVPPRVLEENQKRLVEWQTKQGQVRKALEAVSGA
jgi:valyl-tRNA synthetase